MKKRSRNAFQFLAPILSVFFMSLAMGPVQASTFQFSFFNVANGGGLVTGLVILDKTDTAATSLTVQTNSAGFGIGEYVGNPTNNVFEVHSGQITSAFFLDFGITNTEPAVTCCSIRLELGGQNFTGLTNESNAINENSHTNLIFAPVVPVFSDVPLPAALPLFASGLGVLGFLEWRRKRKLAA